jgi:hypothetical protein
MPQGGPDDETLAATFAALGSLPRLALLREIRVPRTLREIEIQGSRKDAERVVARQTVREHLDRLERVGLALSRDALRAGGPTREYHLNHPMFFSLSEELRELAQARSIVEPRVSTVPLDAAGQPEQRGPRLVLLKGADEERVFPLRAPDPPEEMAWTLGRSREAAISLDYDPFVSMENSVVRAARGRLTLENVPSSRNGTRLNLRRIEGPAPLAHGDVVHVGRSALVYWER